MLLSVLQLENDNFLDVKMVQPLLDLVDRPSEEAEFDVAKTYIAQFNGDEKTKPTTAKLLSEHCEAFRGDAYSTPCKESLSEPLPQSLRTLFLF